MDVPHDYLVGGTGTGAVGQGGFPRGDAWYRKKFRVPEEWGGGSSVVQVEFDGVFKFASVYLNGRYLATHVLGYTGFSVRLDNTTPVGGGALRFGDEPNVLAVFVSADHGSEWWYAGGGIYRHVRLVRKPASLHFVRSSCLDPPDPSLSYAVYVVL